MRPSLKRAAPAKVNLALHVTGRRADGYHLLDTLVAFTRLGDHLAIAPAERDTFAVTGPFAAQVPDGATNLVLAARDWMRRRFGAAAEAPVALTLRKELPVAAGIGGGSSDAAAALALLASHWQIGADLEAIALELGADVPMCLAARPLIARGIGEALRPVPLPALPLVLVNPALPLATPDVFARLKRRENQPLPPFRACRTVAEAAAFLSTTRNDLEAPALSLAPVIGEALAALRARRALLQRMSGSGATCFGIFATGEEAAAAEKAIASSRPGWFVRATSTEAAPEVMDG